MALEDILKKIEHDAQIEAQKIKREAHDKASAITLDAENASHNLKSALVEQAKKAAHDEEKRIVTMAMLESRKETLIQKRTIVDQMFEGALKELAELKKEEYLRFMKKLVLKNVKTRDEQIIVSARHRAFWTDEFIRDLNANAGQGSKLALSAKTGDFAGGFVLAGDRFETDCTLETIIKIAKEQLETKVSEILFDGI